MVRVSSLKRKPSDPKTSRVSSTSPRVSSTSPRVSSTSPSAMVRRVSSGRQTDRTDRPLRADRRVDRAKVEQAARTDRRVEDTNAQGYRQLDRRGDRQADSLGTDGPVSGERGRQAPKRAERQVVASTRLATTSSSPPPSPPSLSSGVGSVRERRLRWEEESRDPEVGVWRSHPSPSSPFTPKPTSSSPPPRSPYSSKPSPVVPSSASSPVEDESPKAKPRLAPKPKVSFKEQKSTVPSDLAPSQPERAYVSPPESPPPVRKLVAPTAPPPPPPPTQSPIAESASTPPESPTPPVRGRLLTNPPVGKEPDLPDSSSPPLPVTMLDEELSPEPSPPPTPPGLQRRLEDPSPPPTPPGLQRRLEEIPEDVSTSLSDVRN